MACACDPSTGRWRQKIPDVCWPHSLASQFSSRSVKDPVSDKTERN